MNKPKSFIDLQDLLKFDPEMGDVRLFDQRMLLMHGFSMSELRRELLERLGSEIARGVFTRLGYQQGIEDYTKLREIWGDSAKDILPLGPRLRDLEGYVRNMPHHFEFNESGGEFYGDFTWMNSWEAEAHLQHFGISGTPACWMNVGYATAYATHAIGKPILAREIECVAMGHDRCKVLMKPASDWNDEGVAADLGFLQMESFIDPPVMGGIARFNSSATLPRHDGSRASELVGASSAFKSTVFLLKRVAKTDSTVLFLGESGVGKERFSKALHQASERSKGAFVSVNCAAIPENLVESELFGVERGAYTGANRSRKGKFERADGGTLFLDEIGSLPLPAQGKLLRVLQEREVERVGGSDVIQVNVRIVAATNEDLRKAVDKGSFRADLFFRLNVFPINIPSLSQRREDIPLLLSVFIERYSSQFSKRIKGVTRAALRKLSEYDWPGNVRELENMVERAAILADEDSTLDIHHFFSGGEELKLSEFNNRSFNVPDSVDFVKSTMNLFDNLLDSGLSLSEIEKGLLNAALARHDGKMAPAARALGLGRGQMQYRVGKMRKE